MLLKPSFPRCWKHTRFKLFKPFSTRYPHRSQNTHIISTNISISYHGKTGQLDIARNLFDNMPQRTVVSWNALISAYSRWGQYVEALKLVVTMHCNDVKLNETTFSSILSACAHARLLYNGKALHCLVLRTRLESFELVGSALLYLYASCDDIEEARKVFEELSEGSEVLWSVMLVGYVQCGMMSEALDVFQKMPKQDVVAWTTLISGYAREEEGCERALELLKWMKSDGVMPNGFTLDCVVRACGRLGALQEGRIVHGMLIKNGFEFDGSVGGALIEFYCNCEAIDDAKRVYNRIVNPCLKASNSLIGGFILMGRIEDAELIFKRLNEKDPVSYNLMIKGYAVSGRVEESKKLFEEMPCRTIISSNTMISVYSRNGEIDKALTLFEETKEERNLVTWNSMISSYIQNDMHEDALKLYVIMRRLSIDRTRSTFSALFHACSCLGSLQQGQLLHSHLIKTPFESNVYVGTSLIDMYSKCGSINDAQKSFMSICSPNVAAWTALINGYAHYGLGSQAISLFQHMLEQGVTPNAATFVGILCACGRAGLINEGMKFFRAMEKCYEVIPTLEHYACVVDLLGRSGRLKEAEEFIKEMPIEADTVIWGALLSACWFWMNMEVGERVAEKMFSLDPKPISAYVILSNIYAVLGKWREKMNVRNTLRGLEVKKDPGCSWIELNRRVHVFSVEDRAHPDCNMIYKTLEHVTENLNSVVQFDFASLPITDANSFNATYYY